MFINKPKKQFFINFFLKKNYNYSIGLILRALKNTTRSYRRNNLGINIFFLYFSKKINLTNNYKIILSINSIFNLIFLKEKISKLFKNNLIISTKFNKNYLNHNLKKVTFIKRKLRKIYPLR